jgi:hypothetical protein
MTHVEITFTPIQPGQGVVGAIVLGKLQLVRRRDEVAAGVVVLLRAATTVGRLPAIRRRIVVRRLDARNLDVQLCVREVDALDGCGQCVLLGTQVCGGRLKRAHLRPNLLHGQQSLIHGLQLAVHRIEALQDGHEDIVGLAAGALAGVGAQGDGSEPVPRDTKLSPATVAAQPSGILIANSSTRLRRPKP